MSWFRRRPDLEDRVGTLSTRLDDVESGFRRLRAEWTDVEERIARMTGRLAKRASRDLEALQAAEEASRTHGRDVPEQDDEVARRRAPRAFPGGGRGAP